VFLEEEYFFQSNTQEPVIVDCGSNIGLSTLYFKEIYPKAKILAIEAHPVTFATLQKNVIENNLRDVEMLNVAVVGSDANTTEIYFSVNGDTQATTVKEFRRGNEEKLSKVSVKAAKLSTLLPEKVDLLKMDIEGNEVEVLKEIEGCFPQIDQMLIEYTHIPEKTQMTIGQFLYYLENSGYSIRLGDSVKKPVYNSRRKVFTTIVYAYRDNLNN
jgi:FkbM family methyltransferase